MNDLKSCIVHTFKVHDVDDVELYAAEPIYNWQQTDAGKWVMKNAVDIYWVKNTDVETLTYQFKIVAKFMLKDYVFWELKYK
jgi:hypothetical protein